MNWAELSVLIVTYFNILKNHVEVLLIFSVINFRVLLLLHMLAKAMHAL